MKDSIIDYRKERVTQAKQNANTCVNGSYVPIFLQGYVRSKKDFCCNCDEGKCHVYVWKHMFGDIFYVGKGQDDRWLKAYRNLEFSKHLDNADCVVYKIVDGISDKDARFYERYISYILSSAGYNLVNKDNNVEYKLNEDNFYSWADKNYNKAHGERMSLIFERLIEIIHDVDFSPYDCISTQAFLRIKGESFFSSSGWLCNET